LLLLDAAGSRVGVSQVKRRDSGSKPPPAPQLSRKKTASSLY
jgi:hypothetical protein